MKSNTLVVTGIVLLLLSCTSKPTINYGDISSRTPSNTKECKSLFNNAPKDKFQFRSIELPSQHTTAMDLILRGLVPNTKYNMVIYRTSPNAKKILRGRLSLMSDQDGTVSLNSMGQSREFKNDLINSWLKDPAADGQIGKTSRQKIISQINAWTPMIKAHASYLFLKTMNEVETSSIKESIPTTILDFMDGLDSKTQSDHIFIQAFEKDVEKSILFRSEIIPLAPSVKKIDLSKKTVRYRGQNYPLDGFAIVPKGKGPFPTVVLWGGSGGNIPYGWANYLAQNGIAVVAIRYFSYDAKDPAVLRGAVNYLIHQLPIERFGAAVTWAKRQEFVNPNKLFIMGESRGGESALLVSQYLGNQLNLAGTLALRPFHYSVGAKVNGSSFTERVDEASWTFSGKDIPFIAFPDGKTQLQRTIELLVQSGQIQYREQDGVQVPFGPLAPGFTDALSNSSTTPPIDVSKFGGRLFSVAGSDDQVWPSPLAIAELRHQRANKPNDQLFVVEGAGHYTSPQRSSVRMDGEPYFLTTDYSVSLQEAVRKNEALLAVDGGHPVPNAFYDLIQANAVLSFIKPKSGL
ncbi:hypothetical protein K2X05_09815 [bacterium]|nr:hypothetical protein [bacterium]